jgi:hypothetical protein
LVQLQVVRRPVIWVFKNAHQRPADDPTHARGKQERQKEHWNKESSEPGEVGCHILAVRDQLAHPDQQHRDEYHVEQAAMAQFQGRSGDEPDEQAEACQQEV